MGISKQDMIAQIESEYEEETAMHLSFEEYEAQEYEAHKYDEEEYLIQSAIDNYEDEQIDSMIEDDERAASFVARIVDAYKRFVKEFPERDAAERKEDGDISPEQALANVEATARLMSRYI